MKRRLNAVVAAVLAAAVIVIGALWHWPWYAQTVAAGALGGFALLEWYEYRAVNPRYLAFVAAISAIAAVGRAAVQGIPGVQPATFFVILAGFSVGPATGAAVGAFTAVGSNLFLGEGAWTPWQMVAWGLIGWSAGMVRLVLPKLPPRWLTPFGLLSGYVFGWIMNLWVWFGGPVSIKVYLALCVESFAFDTNHAVTTAVLLLVAGPAVHRVFARYQKRLQAT